MDIREKTNTFRNEGRFDFMNTGILLQSGPEKLSNIKIKVSSIKNLKILIRITFRTTMKKYFHNFIVKKINSR